MAFWRSPHGLLGSGPPRAGPVTHKEERVKKRGKRRKKERKKEKEKKRKK